MEFELKYFGIKYKEEEGLLNLDGLPFISHRYNNPSWNIYYININGTDEFIQFPKSLEIIELEKPPSLDKILKFYCIGSNHEELSNSPDTKEINFINQLKEDGKIPDLTESFIDITGMRYYYNTQIITYCRNYSIIIRDHFIKEIVDYYIIKDKKRIYKLKKECLEFNKARYEELIAEQKEINEELKGINEDPYQYIADICGVSRQEIKQNLD